MNKNSSCQNTYNFQKQCFNKSNIYSCIWLKIIILNLLSLIFVSGKKNAIPVECLIVKYADSSNRDVDQQLPIVRLGPGKTENAKLD